MGLYGHVADEAARLLFGDHWEKEETEKDQSHFGMMILKEWQDSNGNCTE